MNKTHPRFDAFNERADATSPVDYPIIGIYVPFDTSEPIDETPSNLDNLRTFISTPFDDVKDYILIRSRTPESNHSVQRLLSETKGIKAYYAIKHMSEPNDCFYIVGKTPFSYQLLMDICNEAIGRVSGVFQVK